MSDKRAIVVESCWECPLRNACGPYCMGKGGDKPAESCPLPKWPSVTTDFIKNLAFRILHPINVPRYNELEIENVLDGAFKSIGVEVSE